MKNVLVLGYGNPLRGDDGVGPAVVWEVQGLQERGGRREERGGNHQPQFAPKEHLHSSLDTSRSPDSSSSGSPRFDDFSYDNFRCKALHQLTPELAPDVAQADLVIFIDASCDNGPGEVASRRVVPESSASSTSFSHQLTPEVLLAFAERLYGTCPEAVLLTVGAASFEFGEGLSAEVQAAVPVLLDRIRAECTALQS